MPNRLVVAKPSFKPMLRYYLLYHWEPTSVQYWSQFIHFHSEKCIWDCRLQNGGHCVCLNMSKRSPNYMYQQFPHHCDHLGCNVSRCLGMCNSNIYNLHLIETFNHFKCKTLGPQNLGRYDSFVEYFTMLNSLNDQTVIAWQIKCVNQCIT